MASILNPARWKAVYIPDVCYVPGVDNKVDITYQIRMFCHYLPITIKSYKMSKIHEIFIYVNKTNISRMRILFITKSSSDSTANMCTEIIENNTTIYDNSTDVNIEFINNLIIEMKTLQSKDISDLIYTLTNTDWIKVTTITISKKHGPGYIPEFEKLISLS